MSRVCELTGKGRLSANKVSHSNIKTRIFRMPNLSKRKWFIPQLGRSVTLTLSSSALRTIDARGGLPEAILQERDDNLSDRLLQIKNALRGRSTSAPSKNSKVSKPVEENPA